MNQLAKYIVGISIALVICFLAWYFSNILIYILVSAVLSVIGKPLKMLLLRIKFWKYKMPDNLASGITLIALVAVFFSLFFLITPLVGQLMSSISAIDFPALGDELSLPLNQFNATLHKWFPALDPTFRVEGVFVSQFENIVNVGVITEVFNSLASIIIEFGLAVFVIIFITYFFIKEENMFNDMVLALFPDKYVNNVSRALSSINKLLARYFIGISLEAILITTINSLALHFVGGVSLSLAIAVSFLAGVLNVIPYIGPLTGGAFGTVMAFVEYGVNTPGASSFILGVILIFVITHLIDVFVFQPFIYSNSVKAHPLEIFIVILIAGSIAGIIGMLVAIPAYTVIRVFAREFLSHFKLVQKLTDNI
ncbi:MAG: AI-2E family transporter [Bacteroidales bacterium]|nr:AI-2E family transporter [Bacteroidales bacterium]